MRAGLRFMVVVLCRCMAGATLLLSEGVSAGIVLVLLAPFVYEKRFIYWYMIYYHYEVYG